jgi:hypothetical protein
VGGSRADKSLYSSPASSFVIVDCAVPLAPRGAAGSPLRRYGSTISHLTMRSAPGDAVAWTIIKTMDQFCSDD